MSKVICFHLKIAVLLAMDTDRLMKYLRIKPEKLLHTLLCLGHKLDIGETVIQLEGYGCDNFSAEHGCGGHE